MRNLPILLALLAASCATRSQAQFETADTAVRDLVAALRADDVAELKSILGPGSEDLLDSGDEVADRAGRKRFVELYDEKHRLDARPDGTTVLHIGELDWPVPIPIVPAGGACRFDTEAGREEIIARRIGRNELNAIEASLAYVDAQMDYVAEDRDGDGVLEYAQKIRSSPGMRDGLYWETKEGEDPSPLGELAAEAASEGYEYQSARDAAEPRPYHGYHYQVLRAQGENAADGACNYVVGDNMIGGFALVAHPAEYGVSGVMTFVVNHDGVVYQKDLGGDAGITTFDPDPSWTKVER
jgi:hypothetical protein